MSEPASGAYQQELSRSMKVLGNIAITLSGVTPASAVFIIAPAAIIGAGTGAFWAFVIAAVIGVLMALCWAELGARFPVAGGDYSLVSRAFRGGSFSPLAKPAGIMVLSIVVVTAAVIPAVIALGTAGYLGVAISSLGDDTKVIGAIVCIAAGLVAMLNIRFNAWVTGVFLAIELLALAVVSILGLINLHDIGDLFSPISEFGGARNTVAFSVVLTATATAIFSYNGYNAPVSFAEETEGESRGIARAILWSLLITVIAQLVPVALVLAGTSSLEKLQAEDFTGFSWFVADRGGDTLNTLVSLGVTLAIINATIAIILGFARILYSTGRDRIWPGAVNDAVAKVHPTWHTPWVITLVIAAVNAILCLTVDLQTLIDVTGAGLVAQYALVALAALVGRLAGTTTDSPYRMPGWPIVPLAALAALVYVATQQSDKFLKTTIITLVVGLAYWLVMQGAFRSRFFTNQEPVRDDVGQMSTP